ncbi:surface antigen-like variable number repeat protein [Algoriphagus yeomjeoni]|uniref:Surface antigen-like variable number repeat protein n=1 Tax=Algoriphagus yeomjeoni TaxID=291403 RepID=A0A327P6Q9_9BACT|nr:surface antigen-like variable number repeat protein [Algoriphagus yeomjeoni]
MILKKPNILYLSILCLALLLESRANICYAQQVDTTFAPKSTSTPDSVRVNNIFIVGNEKTKKSVILRELDFTTDFYYDWNTFLEILIADQKKIYNLRLFTSVEITPLFTGDNEVEILITVKERWYIVPQVIFQLADRNFSEWWTNQNRDFSRVNYGLRMSHSNVGGRNEKLKFAGQLGFTKALDLQYSKPYIDKNQKHGLAAQLTFKENKTIPIRSAFNKQVFYGNENEDIIKKSFAAALRYTYRRSYYNYHFLTLGYSGTWVSDDVLTENPNYFQSGDNRLRYVFATYTFRHDRRDNVSYATDGELLDLSITKYGIIYTEELDEVEVNLTANKYFKISDKFHFNTGLTADWFLSASQPYTLVRGIGYNPNFVRGYELNVIEGQQLYVHKNSFRWKFVDWQIDISNMIPLEQFNTIPIRLYLSANFDHGFVKDRNNIPENSRLANKYLMGYGTGIDLIGFYDSVLRFEYSLNNSGEGNFFFNFSTPF